jgi:phage terminase small subunit
MALTAKQAKFVREYLIDLNATQAAIRSGYSEKTAKVIGSENLTKPDISAAISDAQAKMAEKTGITAERVLSELALLGFCNMQDYMRAGSDGDPYLDFSQLTREQAAALAEVTVEDFKEGRGKDARDIRRVKFKLADKRAALVDIGKHIGMFRDRVEHTGPDGGPIQTTSKLNISGLSDEQLKALAAIKVE